MRYQFNYYCESNRLKQQIEVDIQMVYIIIVLTYPPHLADEVGKTYIEAMGKVPDDRAIAKPTIRAAVEATMEGMKVTAIYDVKAGKIREALDLTSNRMLIFAKIKGLRYSLNTAYNATEAMGLLGMTAPE